MKTKIILTNAVNALKHTTYFKPLLIEFIKDHSLEIQNSKYNFIDNIAKIQPFISVFETESINHRSLNPNWVKQFYTNLLLSFIQNGPNITIQNLLKQKTDSGIDLFLRVSALEDRSEHIHEIVERGFSMLISLEKAFKLDSSTLFTLEKYALSFFYPKTDELYLVSLLDRLNALGFLSKIKEPSLRLIRRAGIVYSTSRDEKLKTETKKLLTAMKVFVIPRQIKGIQAALQRNDFSRAFQYAELIDKVYGSINTEYFRSLGSEEYEAVFNELEKITGRGGIHPGQFLCSPYVTVVNNQMEFSVEVFKANNEKLAAFKARLDSKVPGAFENLLRIWGIKHVLAFAKTEEGQADFIDTKLGLLMAKTVVKTQITGYHEIQNLTARHLQIILQELRQDLDIEKKIIELADLLSKATFEFDYEVFSVLFQAVAQRAAQNIYRINTAEDTEEEFSNEPIDEEKEPGSQIFDPLVFDPLVILLISALEIRGLKVPTTSFVETDVSFWLNSWWSKVKDPEIGFRLRRLDHLLDLLPFAVNSNYDNEGKMRNSIARIDEYLKRRHPMFHNMRVRIHTHPSLADWYICQTILAYLPGEDPDIQLMAKMLKPLMRDFPVEEKAFQKFIAAPDIIIEGKERGRILHKLKLLLPNLGFEEMSTHPEFDTILNSIVKVDCKNHIIIKNLLILANTLQIRWVRKTTDDAIQAILPADLWAEWLGANNPSERLELVHKAQDLIRSQMLVFQNKLEAKENIRRVRHVGGRIGYRRQYVEAKFNLYNAAATLAVLEKELVKEQTANLVALPIPNTEIEVISHFQDWVKALANFMKHQKREGMATSRYFNETIEALAKDDLNLSMLLDILKIIETREVPKFEAYILDTFRQPILNLVSSMPNYQLKAKYSIPDDEPEAGYQEYVANELLTNILKTAPGGETFNDILLKFKTRLEAQLATGSDLLIPALAQRGLDEPSPVTHGGKNFNLHVLEQEGFDVLPFEEFITTLFNNRPELLELANREELNSLIIERILKIEAKAQKCFDFSNCQITEAQREQIDEFRAVNNLNPAVLPALELSVRSGSYRSMPGILGTVLHVGSKQVTQAMLDTLPETEVRILIEAERVFLGSFGNVRLDILEDTFSDIITDIKQKAKSSRTSSGDISIADLTIAELTLAEHYSIVEKFRALVADKLAERNLSISFVDPLALVAESVVGVWQSWDSELAQREIKLRGYSNQWRTSVTLQEMGDPHKSIKNFSAILYSRSAASPQKPEISLAYGKVGDDLVSGKTPNTFDLEMLRQADPDLYLQILEHIKRIKRVQGADVDIEIIGIYNEESKKYRIRDLQVRQMPIGVRPPSADFILAELDPPGLFAQGKGVNGGAQYGVIIDGSKVPYAELEKTVEALRNKLGVKDKFGGPGIFLYLEYVNPSEAQKMNLNIDGVLTKNTGSGHASLTAKHLGKILIEKLPFERSAGKLLNKQTNEEIILGTQIYTLSAHPQDETRSGRIYKGQLSLINPVL